MKIIISEEQYKRVFYEQSLPPSALVNPNGIKSVYKTYYNPIKDGFNYRLVKLNDGKHLWQRSVQKSFAYKDGGKTESWGGDNFNKLYPQFVLNKDTYTKLNNYAFPKPEGLNLKVPNKLLPLQSDTLKQKYEQQATGGKVWSGGIDVHTVMAILQVAALFVPIAGPFLAAGIGAADAALLYSEGKNEEAGLSMLLLALPGISKIPGVKDIGKNTITSIVGKISTSKPLTKIESSWLGKVAKNAKSIVPEVKTYITATSAKPAVQTALKAGQKKVKDKVKENIKDNIFGEAGVFISRPTTSLVDNVVKYGKSYLKYLKSQAGKVPNKGDLRKGANFFFAKIGNDYFASRVNDGKVWTSLKGRPKTRQGVEKKWNQYAVVA